MTFSSYKLDRILPADKAKFETCEEYKEKVFSNIKFLQFKEPKDEFDKLIPTLYELDDNKYAKIIKTFKIDYHLLKKNANTINEIISIEEDPISSLNKMMDIYKVKLSIVNRMISNIVSANSSIDDIKKCIADVSSDDSLEVQVCKEELEKRYANMNIENNVLKEFCNEQLGMIRDDLYSTAFDKLKKKLLTENKGRLGELDQFKNESKRRFHRK